MEPSTTKKAREQVLDEIAASHEKQHSLASALLQTIKRRRGEMLNWFKKEEPDLIYRFYHQSYKAFVMVNLVRSANDLFTSLAPESTELNDWYLVITHAALSKEFDWNRSNQIWLDKTLPIMQGFWHAKYFLEQMLVVADELEAAPQILPSGWAAVLYLYNLR